MDRFKGGGQSFGETYKPVLGLAPRCVSSSSPRIVPILLMSDSSALAAPTVRCLSHTAKAGLA